MTWIEEDSPKCSDRRTEAQVHFLSVTSTCGTPNLVLQLNSAWCGTSTVSGTGFLSDVNSSTSGSTGGFRQSDPGLRKWQSLSHLAPECATQPFPPSPGSGLRFARGESSYRQAEGAHWLQDAHKRLDTQLDRLRMRNSPLSHNITAAQLFDMKHKVSENIMDTMVKVESCFICTQHPVLHGCVSQQLSETLATLEQEKEAAELIQFEKSHQRRALQEKVLQLEKELLHLRSTLDRRSHDQPTERNLDSLSGTLPKSQDNFNRQVTQNVDLELCKLRDALRDAEARAKTKEDELNQALKKLQISTEENIKDLKAKLTGALFDKDHLIQVNEKLTGELEKIKQKRKTSQSQLQEETLERLTISKRITDLEADCAQLTTEREELLSKVSESGHEEITAMKEKCHLLRESVEVLELEKQKLQDRCMYLEAGVLEREEKLQLQEVEHQKQDAGRLQSNEELKAVTSHWAQKWQRVALTLQSTQEELEEVKKSNSRNESELLLKAELGACKQQLELERSRTLLHRCEDKGTDALAQTEDRGTQTEWVDFDEIVIFKMHDQQTLKIKFCYLSLYRIIRILFVMGAVISLSQQPKQSPQESRRRTRQLLEEETLSDQRLQTLRQLYPVQDEIPSVEGRKNKTVSPLDPETDQQRRMVTEQNSVDRRIWQHGSGLMPVFEEDEEECDCPGGEEAHVEENWHNQSQQMSTMTAVICKLKAENENLLPATLRCKPIQDCPLTAKNKTALGSDVTDLQQIKPALLYPDGLFLAELVDICSPDEEEEEEGDK
ncbi:hypothetical protein F7725_023038 [Dissostichus mawsoni]|uniref:Uncharacterized protein n=1 Tax=Dissostichus mawsoni TaxID=36200 RepID=A0A7J5Z0I6_DISMA|nr:hypothetical protein F7725_023038 [Dissostichus mawsoni]